MYINPQLFAGELAAYAIILLGVVGGFVVGLHFPL